MTLDRMFPSEAESLRTQAHRMLDQMLDYSDKIRDRSVWQVIPDEVRANFRTAMPLEGTELSEVHQEFQDKILPFTAANTHPGFFGWVQGGGSQVGMLAEMLAAGLNANVGGRDQIPLDVERQVTGWMRELFGFPSESSGIFLTGTSMANFVAVVIARDARLGVQVRRTGILNDSSKLKAYASTATHGCVAKAFDMAGLGSDTLRLIATDPEGRIDLKLLAEAVREDRRNGFTPFMVVGSAGTVEIGAIDDLNGIAEISEQEQMWFHVDGALGALAMLAPGLAARLHGIERADTLAFDFHKWTQVPYDAGFLLVRDGKLHEQAFSTAPSYLAREDRGLSAGSPWPCDLGPELSRNFRAFKVWMAFKVYGADALGAVIQNTCDLAKSLAARIRATPELELLAPVGLNIVCFRYRFADTGFSRDSSQREAEANCLNRELVIRLQEAGRVVPSTTTLQGRLAIRAAIVNHRTTLADIEVLVESVLTIGRELQPQMAVVPAPDMAWASDGEELREIDVMMAAQALTHSSEATYRV